MNSKPTGPGWTQSRANQQAYRGRRWINRERRINVDVSLPNQTPRVWLVDVFSWGNLLAQDDVDFAQQAFGCQGAELSWSTPDACSFTVPYEDAT